MFYFIYLYFYFYLFIFFIFYFFYLFIFFYFYFYLFIFFFACIKVCLHFVLVSLVGYVLWLLLLLGIFCTNFKVPLHVWNALSVYSYIVFLFV